MFKIQTTFLFIPLLIVNVLTSLSSNTSSVKEFAEKDNGVREKVFLQQLDHFKPHVKRLWIQRYFINDEFYDRNKTKNSFLYIGGEGLVNGRKAAEGTAYEAAKRYGGIIFVLEHRFYGRSHPFGNISTSNLQYLNSFQALHDIANFIMEMNNLYNFHDDMKWITIGGSYAGSLSAWMRLKFPHLVFGAIASSAPLHAKLEYPEYLQIVSSDIALNGEDCVNNINASFQQLENILENKAYNNITSVFNLCSEFKNPLTKMDKLNLYEYIIDNGFALAAQSHKTNTTMDKICEIMNNESFGTQIERLGEMMSMVRGEECFEAHWDKYVEDLKNDTIDENLIMRQWWYQTCTEFGWYQTTDKTNTAFGDRIPIEYFLNLCKDIFEGGFDQAFIENQIKRTNNRYGSINIETSKIIFLHGSLDPWYQAGLYKDDNVRRDTIIFIEGARHCADLSTSSENDSIQLKNAREKVLQIIGDWLNLSNSALGKRVSKALLISGIYSLIKAR